MAADGVEEMAGVGVEQLGHQWCHGDREAVVAIELLRFDGSQVAVGVPERSAGDGFPDPQSCPTQFSLPAGVDAGLGTDPVPAGGVDEGGSGRQPAATLVVDGAAISEEAVAELCESTKDRGPVLGCGQVLQDGRGAGRQPAVWREVGEDGRQWSRSPPGRRRAAAATWLNSTGVLSGGWSRTTQSAHRAVGTLWCRLSSPPMVGRARFCGAPPPDPVEWS